MKRFAIPLAGLALALCAAHAAAAADKVRLIISTKLTFELFSAEQALAEGYFKQEGLDVSIIYGDGGAATMQALITGNQDVASGVGSLSVLASYAKGAPVKVIANGKRGGGPIVWYVRADSPIESLADLKGGKSLVYSRPGSSTHLATQYMLKESGVDANLVSVGGISASRTQVMSGQVDTGWTVPPIAFDMISKGEARIIASADEDAKGLLDVSIRAIAANANWLAQNRDVAKRFMRAFWKGVLFNYIGGERAIQRYAKHWKIEPELARQAPDYLPLASQSPAPFGNLELLEQLAKDFKMINEPLTPEQRKGFVDIVYDPLRD